MIVEHAMFPHLLDDTGYERVGSVLDFHLFNLAESLLEL